MPWKESKMRDQRIEFVVRAVQGGESISALCREFKVSRPTAYLWINRYKALGSVLGLEERSRRPQCSPNQTDKTLEARVISLRRQFGWGAKKLQVLLQKDGIELPVVTINRIIKRNGLILPSESHQKEFKRFEKAAPNELWQMDFKGFYQVENKKCFPLTVIDDHSRFLLALQPLRSPNRYNVWATLVGAFEQYGLPDAMLMDHGSPWWGTGSELGLSKLSVRLLKQDIKLIYSGIGHPQTQGKVERFHRTLNQEIQRRGIPTTSNAWSRLLERIRNDYNTIRPHEALKMATPESFYRPSKKQFSKQPKAWIYPPGNEVIEVLAGGYFAYRGEAYHLSKALIGEKIAITRLGRKIIVSYRNLILKEIDTKTKHSTFLLHST